MASVFDDGKCVTYRGSSQRVVELALCEQNHIILKKNTLYLFKPHKDCQKCAKLDVYGKEYI